MIFGLKFLLRLNEKFLIKKKTYSNIMNFQFQKIKILQRLLIKLFVLKGWV